MKTRAPSSASALAQAITEVLLEANPVQGTAKAAESGPRERVLTEAELRKLWAALGQNWYSDIVRLLLLTGQRREEIGALAWSEIDFDRGMIVLAPVRTKNSRHHQLPLSRQALAILQHQPRRDFLFSRRKGFANWVRPKAALDKHLGIAPWRLHDLRRTCATGMAELGVQPHIIEAVLNHASGHKGKVAGIYNRASYSEPMREALQRWADHLQRICELH